MAWTTLVVSTCCLLGQAPLYNPARPDVPSAAAPSAGPTATTPSAAGTSSAPAGATASAPNVAGEVLSVLLTPPEELKLVGRWQTLVETLAGTSDRQQQIEITQAYWRLSQSLAEVRSAWGQQQTLELLTSRVAELPQASVGRDEAMWQLQARMTAALARRHEADVSLAAMQYDLAERLHRTAADPLPLPADLPHTGPYKTHFDQIYSSRTAPPKARLIDRLLPIRREAIDAHARAVQSAEDALVAAEEVFGRGSADVSSVIGRCDDLLRRRLAFVSAVRQYNDDIAAYALPVAPQGLSGESLVGILIKTGRGNVESTARQPGAITPTTAIDPGQGANPAVFNQPIPTTPPVLQPTPATTPAPGANPTIRFGEPTLAPPRETRPAEPTPAGPRPTTDAPRDPFPSQPMSSFGPQEVRKVVAAGGTELYQGLVELEKPKRAQELANLLHWDRDLGEKAGQPVTLNECVGAVPEAERRQAIQAFWRTREQIARYQVLGQRIEQLDALSPAVMRHRQQAGGAELMLRLRSERTAAQAELAESRLALANEQFSLTMLMRRPLDGAWMLPSTAPHGGRYRLKFENQPASLVNSLSMRRLATTIPAYHKALEERAESVVVADAVRATMTGRFDAAVMPLEKPLAAIADQADETLAFLETLTKYNGEIALYALTVLPSQTPVPTLVGALVVPQKSGRL